MEADLQGPNVPGRQDPSRYCSFPS
jgi:hypothetical protein